MLQLKSPYLVILLTVHIISGVYPISSDSARYNCPTDACSEANCRLPECRCLDYNGPANLTLEQTPQIVMFTFNRAFDQDTYKLISSIFTPNRRNPTGGRIAATMYVTDQDTDYCAVRYLYRDGHELGSHGLNAAIPAYLWAEANYTFWRDEMVGQKQHLADVVGVSEEEIRGMRAPHYQSGGNTMFRMVAESDFEYDSTMYHYGERAWPMTMDYRDWSSICNVWPCADKCYPGKWEVPVRYLLGNSDIGCTLVFNCEEMSETYQIFNTTFYEHYNDRKAPVLFNLDTIFLEFSDNLVEATQRFIDDILKLDDVYIINTWKAVQWMKTPTALDDLADFKPWRNTRRNVDGCDFHVLTSDQLRKKAEEKEKLARQGAGVAVDNTGNWLVAITIIVLFVSGYILVAQESES